MFHLDDDLTFHFLLFSSSVARRTHGDRETNIKIKKIRILKNLMNQYAQLFKAYSYFFKDTKFHVKKMFI